MAQSATRLTTNATYQYVSQPNAFVRGDVVRFDGVNYVASQADTASNALVIGMVSAIKTAGTEFYITQVGYVYGLTATPVNPAGPFVAGTLYYLSPTNAGKLTATVPVAPDSIVPVYFAITATTGFFLGNYGAAVAGGGGGSSMTWSVITANQTLAVDNGYFVNGVGALNALALPAAAAVGKPISVIDVGGNGFTITQGAGQSVIVGTTTTTVGVGGSIQSTALGNRIDLLNWTANTGFVASIPQSAGASIIVT